MSEWGGGSQISGYSCDPAGWAQGAGPVAPKEGARQSSFPGGSLHDGLLQAMRVKGDSIKFSILLAVLEWGALPEKLILGLSCRLAALLSACLTTDVGFLSSPLGSGLRAQNFVLSSFQPAPEKILQPGTSCLQGRRTYLTKPRQILLS